jgi:hypothetical protein
MSSAPTIPTGTYQLTGRASWPYWYVQFHYHADGKGIWDQVNPDAPDVPNLQSSVPTLPTIGTTRLDNEGYEQRMIQYQALSSDWDKLAAKIQSLRDWVTATVAPDLLAPAMMELVSANQTSLQALIRTLKTELAPSQDTTKEIVRAQYKAYLEAAKQGIMTPHA